MTNATPETWHPIVGYEGWYEVSDHGRVRRVGAGTGATVGRVISPQPSNRGYLRVALWRHQKVRKFTVHQLVMDAFVGPRPAGRTCNHKDGDKTNNRPSNLEWITPQGNSQHAVRTGLLVPRRGERHHNVKLTDSDVAEIRRLAGKEPTRALAVRYGVTQEHINKIQAGTRRGVP